MKVATSFKKLNKIRLLSSGLFFFGLKPLPEFKETKLERADFTLQLLLFVTAEK